MIMMMSNTALSYTGSVLIKNSLENQKDLIVHCKSAHKDMGYHRVHPTGSYNLLYKLHYDLDFPYPEDNHIWCHVWQGHGFKHHQVFKVYDGDHWEAKEDGIYHQWALINNKVFSNLDVDPQETLQLAVTEARLWAEAQIVQLPTPIPQQPNLPMILGRWCSVDGSCKEKEVFSGQGWYSTLESFTGLMGARNIRASLSPLHAETKALVWAIECMRNLRQFRVTFATDCP
ncbi:Plant self-incompatibility S1 protein [Raphanus sativus]|nr:Plant self-incompatibility S1 protein [Raphanus sativus]